MFKMLFVQSTDNCFTESLLTLYSNRVLKFLLLLLCTNLQCFGYFSSVWLKSDVDLSPLEEHHNSSTQANTLYRPICNDSDNFRETLRVCSMDSAPDDYGNTMRHSRVLVFRLMKEDAKLFIATRHVSLPNATVSIKASDYNNVPLYNEFFSTDLFRFYAGTLVVDDIPILFTGHWDESKFLGSAVHVVHHLELECTSLSSADFYTKDSCFYCSVSCNKLTFPEGNTTSGDNTSLDFLDLFDVHISSKGIMSKKSQNLDKDLRNKRQTRGNVPPPLSCSLHLAADHLFFSYIGANSVSRTLNTMLSLINEVDAIFRSVDFDGDGYGDNIGFIVGKVDIHSLNDPSYMLIKEYMKADEYLHLFSKYYDFSQACLGVAFTYRDLGSVSGTSYPAFSDPNLAGGICEQRMEVNSEIISFNTVAVTMYSHGTRMPREIFVLNLVHELGHSFGARHDETSECLSQGDYGSFIMNWQSNPGTEPNNRKFSPCSIRSILPVVKKKGVCLLSNILMSQCGNTIPEDDEECDCGVAKTCLSVDPCCTPSDTQVGPDAPCTVRKSTGNLCSPRKDQCCTSNCSYISASENHVCNTLDGCSHVSMCNGQSGRCPESAFQPDGIFCNNGLDVCKSGTCAVGVCEYHNMTACFCSDLDDQCKVCCKHLVSLTCMPVGNYSFIKTNTTIHHNTGVPCYDRGYCAARHMCILPFKDDPAEAILFGPDSERRFKFHFNNYWFYYFLVALCFLIILFFLTVSYKINDSDHLKALRYGKMMAIFAMGEHQSKVYRQMLIEINNYYNIRMHKVQLQSDPISHTEAVARIKALFPMVTTPYIIRLTRMSASESFVVKLLLIQGHRMRTFT
nr:disintegrin and metalloproteinase domain-containing protein 10-like [Biomphalaria glabrata]